MPDPTTPAKDLTLPTVNGDSSDWGGLINTNFSAIDTALGGTLALSISGNTTLTTTQAASTGYTFTGTLSSPATITWPAFFGMLAITNSTTGGQSITCGISGGGETVVALSGETTVAWSDGTNFIRMSGTGGAIPIAAGNGTAAGYVAKSGPGLLYWVRGDASGGSGWLMVFDATSVPADGAVEPVLSFPINPWGSLSECAAPMAFLNGIVVVFSTTGPMTKTGSTSAFLSWRVQ
jgi:hypothetical protein